MSSQARMQAGRAFSNTCAEYEILNKASGRCVSRSGTIGKAVAAKAGNHEVKYKVQYVLHSPFTNTNTIPTTRELQAIIDTAKNAYPYNPIDFAVLGVKDGKVMYGISADAHLDYGKALFTRPAAVWKHPSGRHALKVKVLGTQYVLSTESSEEDDDDDSDDEEGEVMEFSLFGGSGSRLRKTARCPSNKLLNPATNRCVSKTGALGKSILAKATGKAPEPKPRGCRRQTTAKYTNRPGPPYEGNNPACHHTYRPGNDGAVYKSVPNANNVYSWKKDTTQPEPEPEWCNRVFTCPHGNISSGNIVYGHGLCEGPHYAFKKCAQGCCVHGVPSLKHCSFCAADGERYGWDGSVGGCRCLACFVND